MPDWAAKALRCFDIEITGKNCASALGGHVPRAGRVGRPLAVKRMEQGRELCGTEFFAHNLRAACCSLAIRGRLTITPVYRARTATVTPISDNRISTTGVSLRL